MVRFNKPYGIEQITQIKAIAEKSDHIDVKTFEGEVSLREFIAGSLSYYPSWMKFLYRVRAWFVRLLGMKQEGIPHAQRFAAQDISFVEGRRRCFLG